MDSLSEFLNRLKRHRTVRPRRRETRLELFQRMRRGCAELTREQYFECLRWQRPTIRLLHHYVTVTEGTVVRLFWMDAGTGRTFGRELSSTERLQLAKRFRLNDLLWRLSLVKRRRA